MELPAGMRCRRAARMWRGGVVGASVTDCQAQIKRVSKEVIAPKVVETMGGGREIYGWCSDKASRARSECTVFPSTPCLRQFV